jgi:thioredoxin reductase (NADPH)
MEKLDFLIIGAGPSGMYFAKKCQEFKKKYKLIEKKKVIGGQPMALYPDKIVYDYPNTKEIISRQIIKKLRKGIKQIYINQSVKKIVFKNGKFDVFLTKEQKILADKIVIATGLGSFSFNPLMIKEAKGKENIIYSVKNVRMFRNKSVIVLGGGDSAVD